MHKILLVDDEEDFLFVMRIALLNEGFSVATSVNAKGLTELLDTHPPDLILLDITMRGVSGSDICRQIRDKDDLKHIPVLLFSANRNVAEIAQQSGADGYINKPFDVPDLKATLTAAIRVKKEHLNG